MSHLVSYKWFRITQYIPRFGGVLQECGVLLEGVKLFENWLRFGYTQTITFGYGLVTLKQ